MRLNGNDSALLIVFGALAVASIAIKAAAGPPADGWAGVSATQVTATLVRSLRSQGFSTSIVPFKLQSPLVLGRRGACQLSARDARDGKALMTRFAQDAADIGRVRYLYNGRSYDAPPSLRIRLARIETEIVRRLGGSAQAHILIAAATSQGCGSQDYGLGDITVSV